MTRSPAYPTFEAASEQLHAFLGRCGWPGAIVWVGPGQLLHSGRGARAVVLVSGVSPQPDRAERVYREACSRGLGVCLEALCRSDRWSYVRVSMPKTPDAAERMLFPDGLKLSVACNPPKVFETGRLTAWVFRGRLSPWPATGGEDLDW